MSTDATTAADWHPWSSAAAEVFVPDGSSPRDALSRTTHLGVGAHADDLEIMAYHGILACFQAPDRWFTGVTVTDGAASVRSAAYRGYSDEQMVRVRRDEQRKAAVIGGYAAAVQLTHPSAAVKDASRIDVGADLDAVLATMTPHIVYTHNLADKHDTHVAVALRVVGALRRAASARKPPRVIGCEVWRDLDWLGDDDKVAMVLDGPDHLADALLGVYDSQIAGGKRYDLATRGRRLAHATFHESGAADGASALTFGVDLTPLIADPSLDPAAFMLEHVARFAEDVRARIAKL